MTMIPRNVIVCWIVNINLSQSCMVTHGLSFDLGELEVVAPAAIPIDRRDRRGQYLGLGLVRAEHTPLETR